MQVKFAVCAGDSHEGFVDPRTSLIEIMGRVRVGANFLDEQSSLRGRTDAMMWSETGAIHIGEGKLVDGAGLLNGLTIEEGGGPACNK